MQAKVADSSTVMDSESKQKIERSIWGTTSSLGGKYNPKLESYFGYCHREMRQAAALAGNRVEWFNAILSAFDILKSNHDKPKRGLGGPALDLSVIDLGLRLMLMTGCQAPGTYGGDVFRPQWKDDESLVQYIGRVYPRSDVPPDGRGSQSLSLYKLSADYLKSCANVDIRWTDHLTDHLLLLRGSDWKTLYVFAHPAFIFKSLQTLDDAGSERTTAQSAVGRDEVYAGALSRYVKPCARRREQIEHLVANCKKRLSSLFTSARNSLDPRDSVPACRGSQVATPAGQGGRQARARPCASAVSPVSAFRPRKPQ